MAFKLVLCAILQKIRKGKQLMGYFADGIANQHSVSVNTVLFHSQNLYKNWE
jgi:DNA-binding CsgD family transcriptional regulator